MPSLGFLKAAVNNYAKVGAILPTSRWMSQRISRMLEPRHRFVVELGAGDGAVTMAILEHLRTRGQLWAVEINPELLSELHGAADKRLHVLEGDALEIVHDPRRFGIPRIDAIVSGIPLSFLKQDTRMQFLTDVTTCLRRHGQFVTYQVSPVSLLDLREHFRRVDVSFDARNLPPYFIASAFHT